MTKGASVGGGKFSHLLAPGRIGAMDLRNRIIVTAMGVSLAEDDGSCGDRLIAYHEEQARGGAALIITGVMGVAWPSGAVQVNQSAISDDSFLPGLQRLTGAVHARGAKIAAQLHHGGLMAFPSAQRGLPLLAPSMPEPFHGTFLDMFLPDEASTAAGIDIIVRELDQPGLDSVIAQFANAAHRAKTAGFDAVEVHAGHGYLLSSFLSPASNKRADKYGGALENRARLLLEVVGAVRQSVGADFPIIVKLDSREVGKPNGIQLADAERVAEMLEKASVDAITVTAYHDMDQGKLHSASNIPHDPGANIPAAASIKSRIKLPVIASGRIEPGRAAAAIAAGEFDFLGMGRKLLADPFLPEKLLAGTPEDIRPCIYCYTCVSTGYVGKQVRCAVRPETGFESSRSLASPPNQKHFAVIGGGPAGMEASWRLRETGNRVTLIERGEYLGGTLQFAALAYAPNELILNWLRRRVETSGVDIRLRTEATKNFLLSLRPDHVIVATGALRSAPAIDGVDQPHVLSGDDLRSLILGKDADSLAAKMSLTARLASRIGAATGLSGNLEFIRSVTRRWMPLGSRIVIVGGELVGLELAEFLSERGRTVSVIEEDEKCGRGLTIVRRMRLLTELAEHGVDIEKGARDIRIGRSFVSFNSASGEPRMVGADNVIIAKGAVGSSVLADELREAGLAVSEVGDGLGVGYIEGAIRGAARAVLGNAAVPLP